MSAAVASKSCEASTCPGRSDGFTCSAASNKLRPYLRIRSLQPAAVGPQEREAIRAAHTEVPGLYPTGCSVFSTANILFFRTSGSSARKPDRNIVPASFVMMMLNVVLVAVCLRLGYWVVQRTPFHQSSDGPVFLRLPAPLAGTDSRSDHNPLCRRRGRAKPYLSFSRLHPVCSRIAVSQKMNGMES